MHLANQSSRKPDKLSQGSSKLDKLSQSSMGEHPRYMGSPQASRDIEIHSQRTPGQGVGETTLRSNPVNPEKQSRGEC